MAKITLTDKEAIALCRIPKVTPGAMKKVLTWAEQEPSSNKIIPLLLLQTKNYATRKGQDALFQQVLVKCARKNLNPLWKVIRGDWEPYRVFHALRALALAGGQKEIQRMVELGKTPILRIHWAVILKAANNAGVQIPAKIAESQKELETQRGSSDFYDYFEKRKENWLVDCDQAINDSSTSDRAPSPTKKTPVRLERGAPPFPDVFFEGGEQNAFLKKYKTSLRKRLTLNGMEGLFDEVYLAYYLTALDRSNEALQVVSFIAEYVEFSGNYDIWTPVGYGICLKARLHRLTGDNQSAAAAIERIRVHPFQVTLPKTEILRKVRRLKAQIDDIVSEKSTKWACLSLVGTLSEICFYRETAVPGFTHSEWYSIEVMEALWTDCLRKMLKRLEGGLKSNGRNGVKSALDSCKVRCYRLSHGTSPQNRVSGGLVPCHEPGQKS